MKIYVLACSGKFAEMMNGKSMTGDKVELIHGYTDRQKALNVLGVLYVEEPEKWGVRATSVYTVEID